MQSNTTIVFFFSFLYKQKISPWDEHDPGEEKKKVYFKRSSCLYTIPNNNVHTCLFNVVFDVIHIQREINNNV